MSKLKLPKKLKAACCPGRTCGNIELYLDGTLHNDELKYIYRRESNGDSYTQPMTESEMLNWIKNKLQLNNE